MKNKMEKSPSSNLKAKNWSKLLILCLGLSSGVLAVSCGEETDDDTTENDPNVLTDTISTDDVIVEDTATIVIDDAIDSLEGEEIIEEIENE